MNASLIHTIQKIASKPEFQKNPCFFIYELDEIVAQLHKLCSSLPSYTKLLYAVKANPHPTLLSNLSSQCKLWGAEVSSLGELETAVSFFEQKSLVFTGPAKTNYELSAALSKEVGLIIVESINEAARIQKLAEVQRKSSVDILIRVNLEHLCTGSHTQMSGFSSKFGIDEFLFDSALTKIGDFDRLKIRGIHSFAGSGFLNYQNLLHYFDSFCKFVGKLNKKGFNFDSFDLGGGFGIDYDGVIELDIVKLGVKLGQLIDSSVLAGKNVYVESGRYIVGSGGYYVTEIIDIKKSLGKTHIITAGGINHQRRPCATETNHPVQVIKQPKKQLTDCILTVKSELVDIDGPLCLADDYLAKSVFVQSARVGDLIVIEKSGAYGATMGATRFLSHPPAKEYFIEHKK